MANMMRVKLVPLQLTEAGVKASAGRFSVQYYGKEIFQAYLYPEGKWWVVASNQNRIFPGRRGKPVWNLDMYFHESLGSMIEYVIERLDDNPTTQVTPNDEPDFDAEATAAYVNQDR